MHKNESRTLSFNSKWIKHLNIGLDTMTLLEGNTGEIPQNIGMGEDFLDKNPKAQAIKAKLTNGVTSN